MKQRSNLAIMAGLIGLVKPLMLHMILAVTMGVVGFLCAIGIPVLGAAAIYESLWQQEQFMFINFHVTTTLRYIVPILLLLAVFRGILRYTEQACNHYIAFKLLAHIRDRVFGALRRLAPAKLEVREKGNLIAIITSDVELLEVFYAHTISPVCIAVIVSFLMSLLFYFCHPLLALFGGLAYLSVGVLLPLYISKKNADTGRRYREEVGELNSYVLQSMRGLDEDIQYGNTDKRLAEFMKKTDLLAEKESDMKALAGTNTGLTSSLILLFSAGMLLLSGYLYQTDRIAFGETLLAVVGMISSFGPVVALANLSSGLSQTLGAGNRVLNILAEQPIVAEVEAGVDVDFQGANYQNVTFAYEQEPILNDFNVSIQQQEILGVTGKSGSGKSTMLRLLMRFWEVQKGAIHMSGTNINQITTASLRKNEGFVTQETYLFQDTIANNVRLANPAATQEEVIAACKKASVHDFIMELPDGYETKVGELGNNFSGGEKQRIGLARSFLYNAPLLLLDEPTSNLDSLNEAVILKSLKEEKEERTILLVSHRKSTMGITDRMIKMGQEKGET
jgi:ATP-binding cassette subfamily C protein